MFIVYLAEGVNSKTLLIVAEFEPGSISSDKKSKQRPSTYFQYIRSSCVPHDIPMQKLSVSISIKQMHKFIISDRC